MNGPPLFRPVEGIIPWPKSLGKRIWHPLFKLTIPLTKSEYECKLAEQRRIDLDRIENSFTTGTCSELMWVNKSSGSANASTSSETGMFTGLNDQPVIPALYFANRPGSFRAVQCQARGYASTTSTPTVVGQWRMGTTQGVTQTGGVSVGQNAALTCGSSVTNLQWESVLDMVCTISGMGANNATVVCSGWIHGPLFSSLEAQLAPSSGALTTLTATFDASVTQYIVFNWTWSASSSSNTATFTHGKMYGLN